MTASVLDLDAAHYQSPWLHGSGRVWTETNCYLDVWIELLQSLGFDPVAGLGFTLAGDFHDPHWSFLKPPVEDLRRLWGIEVDEVNLWRPLIDVVEEQLGRARLVTVEVDSWYLPDTAGVSYRRQHVKTTIVPNLVDRTVRRLGYFHGGGYQDLVGDDFTGALGWSGDTASNSLAPYLEIIRLDRRHNAATDVAADLACTHLRRRSPSNPITRLSAHIGSRLPHLSAAGLEHFHQWAFDTIRQCGANAELAATFVDWLDHADVAGLSGAATKLREVATATKSLQFALARAARGRPAEVEQSLTGMAEAWQQAMDLLDRHLAA